MKKGELKQIKETLQAIQEVVFNHYTELTARYTALTVTTAQQGRDLKWTWRVLGIGMALLILIISALVSKGIGMW